MIKDDLEAVAAKLIADGNEKVIRWIADEITSAKFTVIEPNRYRFVTTRQNFDIKVLREYYLKQGILIEAAESYSDNFSTFILSTISSGE